MGSITSLQLFGENTAVNLILELRILFFLLNRLPEVWGADAASFNPDRFLAISGGVAAPAQGFLPFGSGARSCVGQSLALLEARTFLRELLDVYELRPVPGFAPSIKAGVSLTSAGGVRVRLVKRAV